MACVSTGEELCNAYQVDRNASECILGLCVHSDLTNDTAVWAKSEDDSIFVERDVDPISCFRLYQRRTLEATLRFARSVELAVRYFSIAGKVKVQNEGPELPDKYFMCLIRIIPVSRIFRHMNHRIP